MLTVRDNNERFELNEKESISLELKLNVTSKGKEWSKIGDHLYNFGTKQDCVEVLIVTTEQLSFLQLLMSRLSYRECYGL